MTQARKWTRISLRKHCQVFYCNFFTRLTFVYNDVSIPKKKKKSQECTGVRVICVLSAISRIYWKFEGTWGIIPHLVGMTMSQIQQAIVLEGSNLGKAKIPQQLPRLSAYSHSVFVLHTVYTRKFLQYTWYIGLLRLCFYPIRVYE